MSQYKGIQLRLFYLICGLVNLIDDLAMILTLGLWQPRLAMHFHVWHFKWNRHRDVQKVK